MVDEPTVPSLMNSFFKQQNRKHLKKTYTERNNACFNNIICIQRVQITSNACIYYHVENAET